MASFQGSCLCQSVKYEASGEVQGFYLCHCSNCRKVSGSAHGANIFIKVESFTWLCGEDRISRYNLPNTRFAKAFCINCSSATPNHSSDGLYAVIPAGSLDSELQIKPTAHIHCDSRAKWDRELEKAPHLEGFPG